MREILFFVLTISAQSTNKKLTKLEQIAQANHTNDCK